MQNISKAIKKKDHEPKISGHALYVDDHVMDGMLYGRLLHSAKVKAHIVNIILPELRDDYFIVGKNDITGVNRVHIVQDDTPVYAEDTVEYIGEPILMFVGPDFKEVERILKRIVVAYSRVSFAGILNIEDGKIINCTPTFGAVSDVIIRWVDIDVILMGKTIEEATAIKKDYLAAYNKEILPIRGRSSAEYRKVVCMNLLRDFLESNGI